VLRLAFRRYTITTGMICFLLSASGRRARTCSIACHTSPGNGPVPSFSFLIDFFDFFPRSMTIGTGIDPSAAVRAASAWSMDLPLSMERSLEHSFETPDVPSANAWECTGRAGASHQMLAAAPRYPTNGIRKALKLARIRRLLRLVLNAFATSTAAGLDFATAFDTPLVTFS